MAVKAANATGATLAVTAKCANHKECSRQTNAPYAIYCVQCFRANAARKGSLSSGNFQGKGSTGNAGNSRGKGSLGNAGNVTKGRVKDMAGELSGLRRSAKSDLVVKREWPDLILARRKTWELRGGPTTRRGWS